MLQFAPRSNRDLRDAFTQAAAQVGVPVLDGDGWTDSDRQALALPQVPSVGVTWVQAHVSPEVDTVERLRQDRLAEAGEVLTLVLTKMVRQARY
jgi:hypothetical protein